MRPQPYLGGNDSPRIDPGSPTAAMCALLSPATATRFFRIVREIEDVVGTTWDYIPPPFVPAGQQIEIILSAPTKTGQSTYVDPQLVEAMRERREPR